MPLQAPLPASRDSAPEIVAGDWAASSAAGEPRTAASVLELHEVGKSYPQASGGKLDVLRGVTLTVARSETLAIIGPSGSGKTTLLGLCAGLDRPSRGRVVLCGSELGTLDEDDRARVRSEHVGFVFQNFQLVPTLTALENVLVPAELRGRAGAALRREAAEWLTRVGLGARLDHYPVQLSGGEQQRVALARAFINRPEVLFADEPTGNLDGDTARLVEQLLFDLNAEAGTTLVIVTHNPELAARCQRVVKMRDGAVVS